jgi:glycosyltransferase involved in cell wall biosynthesis/SAM-dependent methyltransferase
MRIFALGLPHTVTSPRFSSCAYTMKVWNLCRMMKDRGHEVIHLGNETSHPICDENVAVASYEEWSRVYEHPGTDFFDISVETPERQEFHRLFADNMRRALEERIGDQHDAIICISWGGPQHDATQPLKHRAFVVESGIGYQYPYADYRVYESYAWLHMIMGRDNLMQGGTWYYSVIPNAFDPEMFEYRESPDGYFLYLGRLTDDKGVSLAVDVARRAGRKLKMAGQGNPDRFIQDTPHVEYLGVVGVEERKELLAGAAALLCPTFYVEPFGGVAVEAQLSGTPVITTDWGAFTETVLPNVTGYRCRTMDHFDYAARNIDKIDPANCRKWAMNYSLASVSGMYEEFFQMLLNLRGGGFYMSHPDRTQMNWLRKSYPVAATEDFEMGPHSAPPLLGVWDLAQEYEHEWWRTMPEVRWPQEIRKQDTYARLMGLPPDLNMGTKTILDVGCGPVSMLLRATHGGAVGVDPQLMSEETKAKYAAANVALHFGKAEDFEPGRRFDEGWIYNCLQHVDDPNKVMAMMLRSVDSVRIFEWIDTPPSEGHPHTLTSEHFDRWLSGDKWLCLLWNTGEMRFDSNLATGRYIAIHASKIRS